MGLCYPGMIFDTFSLVLPVPNSDLFLPTCAIAFRTPEMPGSGSSQPYHRLTVAHPGILIWSCDFLGGKSELVRCGLSSTYHVTPLILEGVTLRQPENDAD